MADDGRQHRRPNFRTAVEDVKAMATVFAMEAKPVLGRRAARLLGVLALFAVVVSSLLFLLNWYIDPDKSGERNDLILTLAQILGGAALLSGLYFTWRTLQVNREGQITERFTRAIEQLGKVDDKENKQFEIRLGGIYSLERIARESEEDYWSIMEILTAYLRQNAPSRLPEGDQEAAEVTPAESKSKEDSMREPEAARVPPLDPDIQAIVTVLRRRTRSYGHGERERFDLRQTNLSSANFTGADLAGADLSEACLSEAIFWKANLSEANFTGANLSEADLSEADLSSATFRGAHLSRAVIWGRGNLEGTDFSRADLSGTLFEGADLSGTILEGADLSSATFSEAHLSGAFFLGTENFTGADLRGADLRGAGLIQAQLEEAYGDKHTQLPSHLTPPAHWGGREVEIDVDDLKPFLEDRGSRIGGSRTDRHE